jgi:uncharacterized protein (TIGR02145 family)
LDTFHLSEPLGQDSVTVQLWTLGIRTSTIFFSEQGSSAILAMKPGFKRDSLDILLLSKYDTTSQKPSFTALGEGRASLVAYFASLLLSGDTALIGKTIPVGMNADSIKKDLVYLAQKKGLTGSQLVAKKLLPGFDSATVALDVKLLIKAGVFNSNDSAAIFPPYPVWVKTSIAVSGGATVGGDAVSVSGAFGWSKGKVVSPKFEVHTAKGVDPNFTFATSVLPSGTAVLWTLDSNLTIQAKSSASAGTDTLVITLSSDSGYSATSRTTFQVRAQAPKESTPPTLKVTSPSKDTTVSNATSFVVVSASASDSGSGLASVKIGTRPARTSAPFTDTIYLAAGIDTIVVQAWDNAGNRIADTIHVTRTPPVVVIAPPKVRRVSPLLDTTVAWSTKSIVLSWTVTDDSSFTVSVNGTPMTSNSALYQTPPQSLATGPNTFVLQVLDGHGTAAYDTIHVTRQATNPPPVVARSSPTQDTVIIKSQGSLNVSWTVTDPTLQSVTINGNPATLSGGVYSSSVSFNGDNRDSLWVTLVATDSSKTANRDSIKVRRLDAPVIMPNGALLSGNQTTNAKISSNLPGSSISYSTNKSAWLPFSTDLPISTSQILYAKTTLGGVNSDVDSVIFLYAPSLPASGPVASGATITIVASGAAIEDSLSTGGGWTSNANFIQLYASAKIYARSRLGSAVSSPVSAIYVLPPILSPNPVAASYADTVTVKASDLGADFIQWSTNNANWTTGTIHQFTASGTFYARSSLGGITSTSASAAVEVKHDTTLRSLTISGNPVVLSGASLTPDSLPGLTKHVGVVAVQNDPFATVTINGGTSDSISLVNDSATVIVLVSSGGSSQSYTLHLTGKHSGTFTDTRDGQSYKAVKIGSQWWMAQNLNYAGSSATVGRCYNDSGSYCANYGRLYAWAEAMDAPSEYDTATFNATLPAQGVCPNGWHVPSDSEWTTMQLLIVDASYTTDGTKLKSTSGWSGTGSGTNTYGFRALPGGEFYGTSFYYVGDYGFWWSATEYDASTAWNRSMFYNYADVGGINNIKSYGFSLRCMKD